MTKGLHLIKPEKEFSNSTLKATLVLITTGTVLINKRQNHEMTSKTLYLELKQICPNKL